MTTWRIMRCSEGRLALFFAASRRGLFIVEGSLPGRSKSKVGGHLRTRQNIFRFLIEDNAINYPQDRTTRAYSAGYYLNNAKFRLREVWDNIPPGIYEPEKESPGATLGDRLGQQQSARCLGFSIWSPLPSLRFHQRFR